MKNLFFILCISLFIGSCNSDDDVDPSCIFLIRNLDINATINLNLPQFNQLQFIGNSIFIPNFGNQGIIVTNTGSGFFAWDASDPNHEFQSCSRLTISGGLSAVCGCEDETMYSLVTGQALNESLPCSLINYRVQQEGNTLFITN